MLYNKLKEVDTLIEIVFTVYQLRSRVKNQLSNTKVFKKM